jgi:hypothetical protein
MSIIVTCPGCFKSFKVSDQFAGKSGACPNCKKTLQVPTKEQEVTVHAPEEFAGGGKGVTGKLVTKPIERTNAKFNALTTTIILAGVVVAVIATWVGGRGGLFANLIVKIVGLAVVSPALVVAAYEVLRDDELEPYRGRPLMVRVAACSLAYMGLWGIFTLLVSSGWVNGELWNWLFIAPPLVALGGGAALASLDLEYGDAVFHCSFYLIATVLLRWLAGLKWVWEVGK